MSKFDLSQYEMTDTAVLTVQNVRGDGPLTFDGQPVRITLYGPGSTQFVQAEHRANNAQIARAQAAIGKGRAVQGQSEATARETAEKLAACTVAIDNFPIDGGPLALYSNPKLGYIRKQVEEFLRDSENFLPTSATS